MSNIKTLLVWVVVILVVGASWGITKKTAVMNHVSSLGTASSTRSSEGAPPSALERQQHAENQQATLSPSQEEDRRTFQILTRDTLKALPSTEQLRATIKSNEDAHHTPPALMEAGRKLGAIAQRLASNSALRLTALDFYKECALDGQLVDSIRALCFGDFQMHHHDGDQVQLDESEIPQKIRDLASKLGG